MTQPTTPSDGQHTFVIGRTFPVDRQRMWRAWTTLTELQSWFGPRGCTMPAASLDLRPGGYFHYRLLTADGQEMWGIWTFREIVAPAHLAMVQSFSDSQGGVARHPMSPTWPRQLLAAIAFAAQGGGTAVEVRWSVLDGTDEERRTFDGAHDSMQQGWSGTFERLAEHLARG